MRSLVRVMVMAVCATLLAVALVAVSEPPTTPAPGMRADRIETRADEPLTRTLPLRLRQRARTAWRRLAPSAERGVILGFRRVPERWRGPVQTWRRLATEREGLNLAGVAIAALCLGLWFARRARSPGDLVVCIDYPAELKGSFTVRLLRRPRSARRTPSRSRAESRSRASSRTAHHRVARETQFRELRPGRYWIAVEGDLREPGADVVQASHFEVRKALVRARRTVRTDFDFRPTLCALTVKVLWDRQPVEDAAVALFGNPHSLRYARRGAARIDIPLGCHRVVVGSGDRVAERDHCVRDLQASSVEIDLSSDDVVFKGCPHAVTWYLRGDFAAAGQALERDGQGDVAERVRALRTDAEPIRRPEIDPDAPPWETALAQLARVPDDDARYEDACLMLADQFQREGRLEEAICKIEQALGAVSDEGRLAGLHERLAALHAQCGDLARALDALERLKQIKPEHPGLQTRIEALLKQIDQVRETHGRGEGARLDEPRYEIAEQIGAGGMGVVFRARDRRLGREVALKRLTENLKDHEAAVHLFWREARAAAALNHPNIVTLFDADEEDGRFFITMELLRGHPLSSLVRAHEGFAPRDVAMLGRQVAAGLEYAHDRGIVHRDIKPGNLFFTQSKVLKIMDFGLAKMTEEVRRQATVFGGTPYYMAPEQTTREPVGPAADMYALGITLFELLVGRVPFEDENVLLHHRDSPPPDPRAFVEEVPDRMAGLVLALLAKCPQDRPTATTVREQLDELAKALPIAA